MKCSAAKVLYRTILGSLPTVWQSLSTPYISDCNDGEFFISHVSPTFTHLLNNYCQASSHIKQMYKGISWIRGAWSWAFSALPGQSHCDCQANFGATSCVWSYTCQCLLDTWHTKVLKHVLEHVKLISAFPRKDKAHHLKPSPSSLSWLNRL